MLSHTLCDPVDCSPPGSCIHGILQARILEWVAIPSLQGIFLTQASCIASRLFTISASRFFLFFSILVRKRAICLCILGKPNVRD